MNPLEWIVGKWRILFNKIKPKAKDAIKIVSVFKTIVESPAMDWLVGSTKTQIDNIGLAWLRTYVPKILSKMEITGLFIENKTADEMIEAFAEYLRSKSKTERGKYYNEFAAYIIDCMKDGEFDINERRGAVALIYKMIQNEE